MLMTFVPGVTNSSLVTPYFLSYIKFVLASHDQADPHGQSILTEPKFELNGSVYMGGWCRPQGDGPSLRASTLIMFAHKLIRAGQQDIVREYLWTGDPSVYGGGIIKRDLDWVANGGWASTTCDLWEEVQSTDFFWNRMSHNRALYEGAAFATLMGDSQSSSIYSKAQAQVASALMGHWNGQYLIESTNRPLDGATLAALNDGVADDQQSPFTPTSEYVAGTVTALVNAFCDAYPINDGDTRAGVPGVLIGRYPGDHYGGGNPWILLTNHLALLFYRGAEFTLRTRQIPSEGAMKHFRKLIPALAAAGKRSSAEAIAGTMLAAGDGVLQRIRYHVAGDGFHLGEQLDKNTGYEISAYDLTWSYGTMLKALYYRSLAVNILENQVNK